MVNTTENNTMPEGKQKQSHLLLNILILSLLAAGIGGGVYGYKYVEAQKKAEQRQDPQIALLQNEIRQLNTKISAMEKQNTVRVSQHDLATLNERIDTNLRLNTDLLNSKVGQDVALKMISRIDDLESRVKRLGKVTSDTALILTAAVMVKEAAGSGQSFEYEAEVLKDLATDTAYASSADEIALYAADGIACRKKLTESFNVLYDQSHTVAQTPAESSENKEVSTDWKDKINQKLSKLITIKYHNAEGEVVEKDIPADEVYTLVNDGQFESALAKMQDNPLYQTEDFQKWQNQARNKTAFDRTIKHIMAATLAGLKVENLKTTND